jgi:hypothetical protein
MWRVFLVLPLVLLGAKPVPVSHLLGWSYAAVAPGWVVDQCTNTRQGCPMQPIAALDGAARTWEVVGLDQKKSYCWRVRVSTTGQASNMVCSG